MHDAPAQRAVGHHGPRLPVDGRHNPGHGQPDRHRLDVLKHPDLDADHLGIGPQVRELHHVAPAAGGPEQEVVVGLARQGRELAGQAEAGTDGFGRLGHSDLRGWRQPGHVQHGVTGSLGREGAGGFAVISGGRGLSSPHPN